jgi:site-specific DNA-methyltransferase (adenine-specific)
LTDVGFKVHNLLSWRKNTCTPNRWGMKNQERIFLLRKGPARSLYNPSLKEVEDCNVVPYHSKTHPTEKPVDLIKRYIEASSVKGDCVLDPFAGTGSTGLAARRMGRRFIGFELDPEYHGVACSRLGLPASSLPGMLPGMTF